MAADRAFVCFYT